MELLKNRIRTLETNLSMQIVTVQDNSFRLNMIETKIETAAGTNFTRFVYKAFKTNNFALTLKHRL